MTISSVGLSRCHLSEHMLSVRLPILAATFDHGKGAEENMII